MLRDIIAASKQIKAERERKAHLNTLLSNPLTHDTMRELLNQVEQGFVVELTFQGNDKVPPVKMVIRREDDYDRLKLSREEEAAY